ncbi:MAG TPA: hypothetical protein VJY33_07205, partial [Isosphaeraceae bacterium]|nr:hypothetical protein [Isosphaeraceae bacterium]
MRYVLFLALTWPTWGLADESKEEKPLPPSEAAKHENEKVSVEMLVRASKNALARRMEIYLDSETDFRDPKNFAIVINQAAADKFKA